MNETLQHHDPADFNCVPAFGIILNALFIVIETVHGISTHSLALLAYAGHNFGDVLTLLLAWGANVLAQAASIARRNYGLRMLTILASPASSILLLLPMGGIAWESIGRFFSPTAGATSMWLLSFFRESLCIRRPPQVSSFCLLACEWEP
jgi:cobalt-zinc-cadmium efflux system protein